MLSKIINYSLRHKFTVLLFVVVLIGTGVYSLMNIPIGAVPDITTNQVQVISTSRNLPTEEVERYLTYPVELEMGNLPGVEEIRSISKFGLSVVTVVFADDMGTYLPRQLISEKLQGISDAIPEGFGSPSMGPISTGLGEIYQYILDVKPGYEDRYDITDLRTIQDWIVKRQLSGIPGVVEVNTWGGQLKTYEVAIDGNRLQAMDITLREVYDAIKSNNAVAGGGYIEKSNEAFFIRAEGLAKSIEDLESILVKHSGGVPVYVRDIAEVGFGAATRFGAITGNGEGEKVLGQVMMLKGADPQKVINAVIDRVDAIQPSLPEGIFINPFLERSDLIERTTYTIAENLIFGFLIVLFVVVFLLGNIRSGLVVASIIPLTLLFALSMMYFFGVEANLMSLGAIDFGIIIDGAVIIVEYIAFSITSKTNQLQSLGLADRRKETDHLVSQGARKMMRSAVFGQIIIIIVFIPVLVMAGVEGKMFRPMALTFCFALIGAMILCFTYVPVVASLFLKPSNSDKPTLSSRFVSGVKNVYKPILNAALAAKYGVVGLAITFFASTVFLFSKMGGEFVPTLDEGDFVIQPVLKTGMSLRETVIMTTRIEQILKTYPEVKQVVSRIGAAEVPTDPMSMEESDVIITLTPKKEWTSAQSKDELADVFKEALISEIPGIEIEFTQPIEMRFNELISGARSDLAIKLFGEDLDILYTKGSEIQSAIENVAGAADISMEKIDGLPQMTVKYDRSKIAKYGINIDKLNDVISMGFAGKSAGSLYEGESRFDIVLKYKADQRNDIDHLRNARIHLPSGQQMPFSEFADINYTYGPAKISRDDTKRRVVIGVNVRGRDLQSVVNEIQEIINKEVNIPAGYNIQYGGQFENLQNASNRLLVAVPISLILIFILLYFAFGSIREALLIYSAIPLAAIGGVLALYIRDMPFSISAGIGFIALFGIAVLNGIVMIEHFKELKSNGMKDINALILEGAVDRLRPVLLTAFAAALGFLPMAISTSAGAEVQRPLATVVIGGLITATLLTLVVLPVLYSLFSGKQRVSLSPKLGIMLIGLVTLFPSMANTQDALSLEEVVQLAMDINIDIQKATLAMERESVLKDATKEVNKTDFFYEWDRNNIPDNGGALHVLGLGHSFKMPGVHNSKKALQEVNSTLKENELSIRQYRLKGKVTAIYDDIEYLESLRLIYLEMDSVFNQYQKTVDRKFSLGGSSIMEKIIASQKIDELAVLRDELNWKTTQSYQQLQNVIQTDRPIQVVMDGNYGKKELEITTTSYQSILDYQETLIQHAERTKDANYSSSLPELNFSLFNGINSFRNLELFPGVQAGVSIPLSKKQYQSRRSADQITTDIANLNYRKEAESLARSRIQLEQKRDNLNRRLVEFENTLLLSSTELIASADHALRGGEIDYFKYLLILEDALEAKIQYLNLVHDYNQTIISLTYVLN